MTIEIRKVSVIGAGVMGAQIAVHMANCGVDVLLLDIVPPELSKSGGDRNGIVRTSLEKIKKARPPALFSETVLGRIAIGNIEDDLERAIDVDWIIEVVPEIIDIKRGLYAKIERYQKGDVIISSNTSGIPLS